MFCLAPFFVLMFIFVFQRFKKTLFVKRILTLKKIFPELKKENWKEKWNLMPIKWGTFQPDTYVVQICRHQGDAREGI